MITNQSTTFHSISIGNNLTIFILSSFIAIKTNLTWIPAEKSSLGMADGAGVEDLLHGFVQLLGAGYYDGVVLAPSDVGGELVPAVDYPLAPLLPVL